MLSLRAAHMRQRAGAAITAATNASLALLAFVRCAGRRGNAAPFAQPRVPSASRWLRVTTWASRNSLGTLERPSDFVALPALGTAPVRWPEPGLSIDFASADTEYAV